MNWFRPVSDAMYLALCAAFGVDPQSTAALNKFVPAYIDNATNAQAPRNMNVCYYAISEMQGTNFDYIQLSNVLENGEHAVQIQTTIPISVLFTFYGESADDDAERFWQLIQWDSGATSPRAVLRKRNIVPLDKPSRPLSVFEDEGTFHRRRCDVRCGFEYLMTTVHDSGHVDTPPDLVLDGK